MEPVEFEFRGRPFKLYTHGGEDLLFRNISRRRSFYELDLLRAVRDAHEPGRAIFDVGANIGNHTVFFAGVLGQKVTSFEPFPKSYEILARNVAENGLSHAVEAKPIGLGDADGQADAENVKPHNFGMVRLRKSASGTIPIARLDDFALSGAVTGTIKIDVEGGEMAVLRARRRRSFATSRIFSSRRRSLTSTATSPHSWRRSAIARSLATASLPPIISPMADVHLGVRCDAQMKNRRSVVQPSVASMTAMVGASGE